MQARINSKNINECYVSYGVKSFANSEMVFRVLTIVKEIIYTTTLPISMNALKTENVLLKIITFIFAITTHEPKHDIPIAQKPSW